MLEAVCLRVDQGPGLGCHPTPNSKAVKGSSTVNALVELILKWQQELDEAGRMIRILLLGLARRSVVLIHSPKLQDLVFQTFVLDGLHLF